MQPDHLTPEQRAANLLNDLSASFRFPDSHVCNAHVWVPNPEVVEVVAAAIREAESAARADEREACAKVADDAYNRYSTAIQGAPLAGIPALAVKHSQGGQQAAGSIADAIRARALATEETPR